MRFLGLADTVYFGQDDYEKMQYFYKLFIEVDRDFVEIEEVRRKLDGVQIGNIDTLKKQLDYYIMLIRNFMRNGAILTNLRRFKTFSSSSFPSLDLRDLQRFEAHRLKLKIQCCREVFETENLHLKANVDAISSKILAKALIELALLYSRFARNLEKSEILSRSLIELAGLHSQFMQNLEKKEVTPLLSERHKEDIKHLFKKYRINVYKNHGIIYSQTLNEYKEN